MAMNHQFYINTAAVRALCHPSESPPSQSTIGISPLQIIWILSGYRPWIAATFLGCHSGRVTTKHFLLLLRKPSKSYECQVFGQPNTLLKMTM